MSAPKSIIMLDQSNKKWLQDDCDKSVDADPFQTIIVAITFCIAAIIAIMAGFAAFLLFGGIWS